MAKQDVLDAINATVAPNNIKGITAESLNNVLTMMAENAGEGGSGDGALRVIVPNMMVIGPEIVAMGELSPASWEEMKSLLEQSGIDPSEYDAVVKASFEHNANVVQQILEKGKAGQGVSVILDQTPYSTAVINYLSQVEPEMVALCEEFSFCIVQPAGLFMQYMNATPEGEATLIGDVFDFVLVPTGNTAFYGVSMGYPSNMLIYLNLDGSLTFTQIEEEQPSSGSGVVTFYMPQDPSSPTSEETENNKAAYASFMSAKEKSIVKIYSRTEELGSVPFMIKVEEDDGEMVIILTVVKEENGTFVPLKFVAGSDGYFNHL